MMLFCAQSAPDGVIRRVLGEIVCRYLADPSTQELSANYDQVAKVCRLFVDNGSGPERPLGATLEPSAIITATRMLATLDGQSLPATAPFLSCDLASGFRWHSRYQPLSDGPQFSIRVHPRMLRPLSDFMNAEQATLIKAAIAAKRTMLIAGATFSGKTTCANAIINQIPAEERLLIIEDTAEIQARPGNVVRNFTSRDADLSRHVREALRMRPDRIIIGEIRGAEAKDFLEAASTGHPGLATIHAGSCDEALARLKRLAGEACSMEFVREAVDLLIQLERMPDGRRAVTDIREIR
jgi:Flp pilus assembly CpaF family ATPase